MNENGGLYTIYAIKVLSNGDIDLSGHNYGDEAIVQNIRVSLNEIYNNCFFAMDTGLDIENMGRKTDNEVESDVRRIVQGTTGVRSVKLLSIARQFGGLNIVYKIDTIYSEGLLLTVDV